MHTNTKMIVYILYKYTYKVYTNICMQTYIKCTVVLHIYVEILTFIHTCFQTYIKNGDLQTYINYLYIIYKYAYIHT